MVKMCTKYAHSLKKVFTNSNTTREENQIILQFSVQMKYKNRNTTALQIAFPDNLFKQNIYTNRRLTIPTVMKKNNLYKFKEWNTSCQRQKKSNRI